MNKKHEPIMYEYAVEVFDKKEGRWRKIDTRFAVSNKDALNHYHNDTDRAYEGRFEFRARKVSGDLLTEQERKELAVEINQIIKELGIFKNEFAKELTKPRMVEGKTRCQYLSKFTRLKEPDNDRYDEMAIEAVNLLRDKKAKQGKESEAKQMEIKNETEAAKEATTLLPNPAIVRITMDTKSYKSINILADASGVTLDKLVSRLCEREVEKYKDVVSLIEELREEYD